MSLLEFYKEIISTHPTKEVIINNKPAKFKIWENSGCHDEYWISIENKSINLEKTQIRQAFPYDCEKGVGFSVLIDNIVWEN